MTLEQVQRHKVRLLDAWRESRARYGFEQAVRDGFYKIVVDSAAEGFVPRDMWLTDRINYCLDQATARETYLVSFKSAGINNSQRLSEEMHCHFLGFICKGYLNLYQ